MLYSKSTKFRNMNVRELQNEQFRLACDLKNSIQNDENKRGLYIQYDCIRGELQKRLGDNAHAADIDFDLYENFVHLYQTDNNGEKPKSHFTLKDVYAYLEQPI